MPPAARRPIAVARDRAVAARRRALPVLVAGLAFVLGACDIAPSTSAGASTQAAGGLDTPTTAAVTTPSPSATASATPSTDPSAQPPTAPAPAVPAGVAMPNRSLTPGETFPAVRVAQVCTSGYATSVRHVELSQYHEVYAAYGIPYPQPGGSYELDHLIPLELGGDNANANLWPEPASPAPGFHQKDDLENTLHGLVCSGRLDLHQAQRAIALDWYAAWLQYVRG